MVFPTAITRPIRRGSNSEVLLPQMPADQTFPTGSHVRGMLTIFKDIDPEGHYKVILDPRALPPPAATVGPPALMPEDAPEPVTLLLLQGDQNFHHRRSAEEPPTQDLEDEADEESDEGDVDAGSTSGPPGKVTEGNVVTLGLLDKGAGVELIFGSVLEAHVPASSVK